MSECACAVFGAPKDALSKATQDGNENECVKSWLGDEAAVPHRISNKLQARRNVLVKRRGVAAPPNFGFPRGEGARAIGHQSSD